MGDKLMFPADLMDLGLWTTYIGNNSVSTLYKPTGHTYVWRCGGIAGSAYFRASLTADSEYYFKSRVYIPATSIGKPELLVRESSTDQVTVAMNFTTGLVSAYRGTSATGTLLGSSASVLRTNQWHCIEARILTDDATGVVQVKVDGQLVLDLSSQDTNAGGSTIDNFAWQIAGGSYIYFTDVVVRDDTWPGTGTFQVLTVTADGTDTDWTASAGDDYQCVDDAPAATPSYADYISTDVSVANTKETLTLSDLSGSYTYTSIPLVGVFAPARLDGAGAGNIRAICLSNASYGNGASTTLTTSNRWVQGYFTVDPDGGGAWDEAAVNALEAGVETI